ncbi:MAG: dTDP-glucose 4,6-dehydratase [Candidatus Saganbacteria bacterium]|nr:dTDP-glucose 4,6-dehydratase [Candidatus Saganbacteria bacterium]
MKLLITGGAGFIGSNFIRHILAKYPDYEVINLDKITYAGNLENLKDIEGKPNYKFVKGDICDEKEADKVLSSGIDTVVNFAAETHVDRSILGAEGFIRTDIFGTYILLEASKRHKVSRYIQISTDEVYGSIERGSFSEKSPLAPNSPYASSKAGGDLLVRSYNKTYNLPAVIVRSTNNYGPYQYPEKFLPLFITNALEGKKLPLYGDGKNVRDWLHVLDNCEAIDLVMHKGVPGDIYNVGGGNERENLEVAKMIVHELGKSEGAIEFVKDRPGHDRRYSIDPSKLKALGWAPKRNFEKGLIDTIIWYKNNRNWWLAVKEKQKEFKEFYTKWYADR